MGLRKEIDEISSTHARTIVLRFMAAYWSRQKDQSEKNMRTLAREYCRKFKKTPKELISTPLPR